MNAFNAHPPIRHHSSECISSSQAQQLLAGFLGETATDPSLHPNSLLTEDGPVNRSSSMGLVLHNLRRVEASLRGEHLAADLSFQEFGGEKLPDSMNDVVTSRDAAGKRSMAEPEKDLEADWQDKDEYEREQGTEQGEVGPRSNALGNPDLDKGHSNDRRQIPAVKRADGASKVDKDERKRKKKEKREQERRERETELAKRRRG
ncbi:MAG: hypothetical protein Q9197_000059 [Variospora fuerteventurae]